MKYIEIEGISPSKVIAVSEMDSDRDIEIEVRNEETSEYINLYLSVPKVKELITFLQNQIKDL